MARVLHGLSIDSLPNPGDIESNDQVVIYREDTGAAYRSSVAGIVGTSGSEDISDLFDAQTSYSAGDYCIYENTLYRFTSAHSGEWDGNDVVATNVGKELGSQAADISGIYSYVDDSVAQVNSNINSVQSSLNSSISSLQSSVNSLPLIQYGSTTITYSGNDSVTKTITFSTKYSSSPYVFTQIQVSSTALGYTDIGIYVSSRSTSNFVLRATANGNYAATVTVYWMAVGAK